MEMFGMELFNGDDVFKLIFKFVINFAFLIILIRFIFYRNSRDKDFFFTFYMFNVLTFFICFLLRKVPMEMGFALGLFAVFGILRYRTEAIPIKEMTYLFCCIGLAMINSLANRSISLVELLLTNVVIVSSTWAIETYWFKHHERSKEIVYENINLITPDKHEELINDLRIRTGLNIHKVNFGAIDFLKDTIDIKIYYYETTES